MNIVVKGEVHYRNDFGYYKTITKKNVRFDDINMPQIIQESSVVLKEDKVRDVEKLLGKHFGADWKTIESLSYYNNIVEGQTDANEDSVDDGCQHCESEEVGLLV